MLLAENMRNSVIKAGLQGKLTKRLLSDSNVNEILVQIDKLKSDLVEKQIIKKEAILEDVREDEIPFEIPDTWRWVRLGRIITFQGGYAFKSDRYVDESDNQVIRLGNVKNDMLLTEVKQVFISEDDAEEAKDFLIRANDILVTMTGTRRKKDYFFTVKVTENDLNGKKLFLNQRVGCFKIYQGVNPDYLNIALKSVDIQNLIFEKETGSANQGNLGSEDIKKYVLVPLPPVEEQQRIVEKMVALMKELDEYELMENQLRKIQKQFPDDMVRALYQYAFCGKLTKQLKTDTSVAKIFEKLHAQEYSGEILYDIPDAWRFVKLDDLVTYPIKRGKSPTYTDNSSVYVFAQKCNLKYGDISLEEAKFLDESTLGKYHDEDYMKDDDIVINSTGTGTLGRVKKFHADIVPKGKTIVVDSHVTVVRLSDEVDKNYVYYYIKFNQPYLESKGVGSTKQKELKPDVIKDLVVPLPPIEEQHRIVKKLEQILPLISELKE